MYEVQKMILFKTFVATQSFMQIAIIRLQVGLPQDYYLYETLSCNKGFEPNHFYVWFRQALSFCGTSSTFAVRNIDRLVYEYV